MWLLLATDDTIMYNLKHLCLCFGIKDLENQIHNQYDTLKLNLEGFTR